MRRPLIVANIIDAQYLFMLRGKQNLAHAALSPISPGAIDLRIVFVQVATMRAGPARSRNDPGQ
jgi:hypothetical protein